MGVQKGGVRDLVSVRRVRTRNYIDTGESFEVSRRRLKES